MKIAIGVLTSVLAIAISAVLGACSQTPTSVAVRTFERAQRMDVACMQIYDPTDGYRPREPLGRPQDECQPVPADLNGFGFEKQLFALVTQSTRGELAVVDLSAGLLIDQNRATPGINFLPVGALPTDVATTPDGKMAFVGSAEPNKAAIYGIPTRRILGDTAGFPADPEPVTLASWPVCALPQNPGSMVVVPRAKEAAGPAAPSDGGVGDGAADGGDAGAPAAADAPDYELVVVLPGDRQHTAKIVTIDPRPFRRGGLRKGPDGLPDYASDHLPTEPATLAAGPILQPGSLAPCPIIAAVELTAAGAVPTTFVPGPAWDDGVKYVEGGVDLTCATPTQAARCGKPPCCDPDAGGGAPDSGIQLDAAVPEGGPPPVPPPAEPDSGACEPVGAIDAGGPVPLDVGPLEAPRLVSIVRDNQTIYVADQGLPLIHVLDMSVSGAPRELPPLLATSLVDPSRTVQVTELAISPPTRDYKRYLYAVDKIDGSIMVYDVTDPATTQRTPLTRPHAELNPFQPPDRLVFSSPVVAVAFARHDVPLSQIDGRKIANTASGVLCNPNRRIDGDPQSDLGFYYRAGSTDVGQAIGARRLRGVFGFATLANGQVFAIDVDDWDSPCRRPVNMMRATSDIAPPQPDLQDTDPYHAPIVDDLSVTQEAFFPMTAPHTMRSEVLIVDDPALGNQLPRLQGGPSVTAGGVVLPQVGSTSENTPLLDVRFALEDPHVHIDQDWKLTYEGALPGFNGVSSVLSTDDGYSSIVMTQPQAHFCAKGVEDWAQGTERANKITQSLVSRGVKPPVRLDRLMTDYVELSEEILGPDEQYWSIPQDCWDPSLASPAQRQNACVKTFGSSTENNPARNFPIVEAYDDRVVLGRFFTSADGRREVVYKDPSNAPELKLMRCCFHSQARFKVRTGQLWSSVGQTAGGGGGGVGFFSHLTTDTAGRCVPSCDPRESLLNGRLPTIPAGTGGEIGRNSPLAMRNPMFNAVIVSGSSGSTPLRDSEYAFSTRGQFRPLFLPIGGSSIAVSPQSMRYVAPLGQMAVVDGASQGLVLLDLRAFTLARAPYF